MLNCKMYSKIYSQLFYVKIYRKQNTTSIWRIGQVHTSNGTMCSRWNKHVKLQLLHVRYFITEVILC